MFKQIQMSVVGGAGQQDISEKFIVYLALEKAGLG